MRWLFAYCVLVVMVVLLTPHPASACPACKDAVAAASDSGEPDDENTGNSAAAYNHSIYMMIAVPYLALAVLTFLVYRGLKKNAEHLRTRGSPYQAANGSPVLS